MKQKEEKVTLDNENFGILCICALRYCMGRETYIPDLIRGIVKPFLRLLTDKDIGVMLNDCDFQAHSGCYGDESIDKPGWLEWQTILNDEKVRRFGERATQ